MWNQENQCYTGTHFGMVKITKCLGISVRCRIININKYIYIYIIVLLYQLAQIILLNYIIC